MARAELDRLHDDLYVLACAIDDTERDLAEAGPDASAKELREILDWLLESAQPLREPQLSAPAVPPRKPS